ncbi:NUDIX domain-containing protein [Kitasatospora sp. NPDC056184]|uniref:NUDIX domain-containing protein n=1 Tax=Kitasatospora sp. NPDC056184 TaxID=3345738 RepID=UPI0035DF1E83
MSVLIRDPRRRVLLVQPAGRTDFMMPGSSAHPDETAEQAASRALADDLTMRRAVTGVLVRDPHPANFDTGAAELLHVVLDGGAMTDTEAGALSLPARGTSISALEWVPLDGLCKYVQPFTEARVRAAYAAACRGVRLRMDAEQCRAA